MEKVDQWMFDICLICSNGNLETTRTVSNIQRSEERKPSLNFSFHPNGGSESSTLKGFVAGRDVIEISHNLISATHKRSINNELTHTQVSKKVPNLRMNFAESGLIEINVQESIVE